MAVLNTDTSRWTLAKLLLALVAKMPSAVVEPEPEANLTGPVEQEANAAEPPVEPPEKPARNTWLLALNAAALIALGAAGLIYWKKRGALRKD